MPNYVANHLTIHGENAVEIMKSLLTEDSKENDGYIFDFNKIRPMPKELAIDSGSQTNDALELYLTSLNPNVTYFGNSKMKAKSFVNLCKRINKLSFNRRNYCLSEEVIEAKKEKYAEYHKMQIDDLVKLGKQAANNVINYGATDWYGWCCKNWGTKWNACNSQIYDTDVYFDTAWSDVRQLVKELSRQYPNNIFEYEFAEEQTAYYTGAYMFKNGEEITGADYDDYSKEAYETFFKLWGGESEYEYSEGLRTYKEIKD